MVVLAVTLQVSVVLVILLDTDRQLTNAYLDSCANGAKNMCATIDELPFGISPEEMKVICECIPEAWSKSVLVNGTYELAEA